MKVITRIVLFIRGTRIKMRVSKIPNLRDQQFGRLAVIRFYGTVNGRRFWECVCECGQSHVVETYSLIQGNSKSCGCLKRYACSVRGYLSRKHGMSKTRLYNTWQNMIRRCEDAAVRSYPYYGGRGIRVCKRWHKFENFYADMGMKPTPAHSIDRINNDGDYCKENCRWATAKEQQRNRRVNKKEKKAA